MLTQLIKQANVTGITASSVATARIPTTGTHYALYLAPLSSGGAAVSVANMKTAIGNMVLRHNGEQIMEGTATFFLDLQKYYHDAYTAGSANVAGIIPIYFAPSHFANFAERQLFAVGTQDIQTMTLDLNILSTTNMATISVYSEVTPENRPRGQHLRIKKYPQSFASTGDNEVSTLPLEGPTVGYKALHIELGTNPGVIALVTVKVGNYAIFDNVGLPLVNVFGQSGRRTQQAAYYHVDFGKNNDISAFLPMAGVQDFRQVINWTTTPTTYNIYAEEIFGLNAPAASTGK